jgi:hypothetical protein
MYVLLFILGNRVFVELLLVDLRIMDSYYVRLSKLDHCFLKYVDLYKYFKIPKSYFNFNYSTYDKFLNVTQQSYFNNNNFNYRYKIDNKLQNLSIYFIS